MSLFTQNTGLKLTALAVAIVLWVVLLGEAELVTTHTAPILYKNLPPGLLIGPDALDVVRVEMRGPSGKLSTDRLSEIALLVDLGDVDGPGERTFTLSDADFHLPSGVTFMRAIPSQLHMRFAKLLTRDVPIDIRILAPPPPGYRVVSQRATPEVLRIAGPEGRVALVASAQTDPIDLSGETRTVEKRITTFISDPQVRFETSPVVTVTVTIEKNPENIK